MAHDVVDHAVKKFALKTRSGCWTDRIHIIGGESYDPQGDAGLVEKYGFDTHVAWHLNRAYGDRADDVARIAVSGYGALLARDHPYLEAEVLYAVRHECAEHTIDVLARRIPLALLDTAATVSAADRVIDIMAREMDWDSDRCREEKQMVQERLKSAI
jgi:glycerol-3-phosphate dehydrogenase